MKDNSLNSNKNSPEKCCSDNPTVLNDAQRFFLDHGISNLPVHSDKAIGWRCRAKLAVRGSTTHPLIGLFKEGTHDVLEIPHCEAHHPKINEAVELVRDFMISEKIQPYDEKSLQGAIRYLQFVIHRPSNKVQLTIVMNSKQGSQSNFPWLEKLWNLGKENLWHSLWLNFNPRSTNTIFGPDWQPCYGPEWLWETFDNTSVCFHPSSFAQANLDLFEKMIVHIKKIILSHNRVAEYYAGVGVIGLCLVEKAQRIECCEINSMAKICFELSRSKLEPALAEKIAFHESFAGKRLDLLNDAEIVIVDPPRKGLEAPLLKALKSASLKQLIYISCGWDSFQKDCLELLQGGWKIQEAHVYLLFPGSEHIETLTVFVKD